MNTFYLLMIATGSYIGPLPEPTCNTAAVALWAEGVVCKQAVAMRICPVVETSTVRMGSAGGPIMMVCPIFDIPQVKLK